LILKRLGYCIFLGVPVTIERLFWGFFPCAGFIDALQFNFFLFPEQDLIGCIF
jgi:hypothetical protein